MSHLHDIVVHEHIAYASIGGFVGRESCKKKVLICSPRFSRHQRIDDADSDIPLAINQYAANWLDEAVLSMKTMCLKSYVIVIAGIYSPVSKFSDSRRSIPSKVL